MTRTFCMINQKGGVGKTSSCFHLSEAFSGSGQKVLIIDLDPQASISQGFFGPMLIEDLPAECTVAALFDDAWAINNWEPLIHHTAFSGVDVCPSNHHLARYNTPCPESLEPRLHAIGEFIDSHTTYDIVMIDCPPNLYRCSWSAMAAADWATIPVTPEDFGTQGLRAVDQAIGDVRSLNPRLAALGHLVTRSDGRLLVHKFYERRLRKLHGDDVLNHVLPELSAFKLAVANRSPVELYDSRSRAARLTRGLAREILDRTDGGTAKRRVA